MITFNTPESGGGHFNSKEVYLFSRNEDDIINIGGTFSSAGMICNLFDVTASINESEMSMLLIHNDLFEKIEYEVYEKRIRPYHFVFSYSENDDSKDEYMSAGHITLPLNIEDINQMLSVCEQKTHYEDIITDLDEKKHALEKISSLGRFTGSLIHDLNNYNTICMTAFDGLKLVNKRKLQDEKVDFLVSKGIKGCKMINSISLKYRRFMFVNENAEQQYGSLKFMVNEAFSFLEKDLNQHGITYKVEVPKSLDVLCFDTSFIQVLVNIISNSIYEIKDQNGGWISIKSRSKKSGIFLYIIDSGTGIAEEVRAKIFDPLFSTKVKSDGTGFGLNFCKQELKTMGMNIRYVDNKNTTFAIEIPSSKINFNS